MLNNNIYDKMAEVEDRHWWFRGLYDLVSYNIKKNFNGKDISIVDAGCGTGGNMRYFIGKGYRNIRGFDISEYAIGICKSMGLDTFTGDISDFNKYFSPGSIDVIMCNDVLCYLDKDEMAKVVNSIYPILKENGIIIMNLPSLNIFGGINDKAFYVRYRFTKKDIPGIFDRGRYELKKIIYWPFLLSPVILFIRGYQRMKMRLFNNSEIKSDIDLPLRYLNAFLYRIVQFENSIMRYKPFGSSLFLVVRKINE